MVCESHLGSLYLRIFGGDFLMETIALLAFLLQLVSSLFEKLANNRLIDHPEKFGLFRYKI